jgi:selenocysteine lyase/cysteine desulfurase
MYNNEAITELECRLHAALETYSNVHRGSGHNSIVTTHLFEHARVIVLEYLGLKKGKYVVIFSSPMGASSIIAILKPENYQILSSQDFGLSLGVRALAVDRKALRGGAPFRTGGGTTRIISPDWVIWADAPYRLEAGTPAIINIIAFAAALSLIRKSGSGIFHNPTHGNLSAKEILYHDELDKYVGKELLDKFRETLIGRGIRVPTLNGKRPYINLDNSASTPTFTPIWNTFCQTWRQPLNIQQEVIHEVRSVCAKVLGASLSDYDLIFTSNTTEAINLAAESLSKEPEQGTETVILSTLMEHTSNELPWRMVPHFSFIRLQVDDEGFLDPDKLETVLSEYNGKCIHGKKRIKLMAVSGASNVLGSINNLGEISRIVHKYGARLLVDAAQLVAHRKVEMDRCGIDYLAFSAHKVYAPFGTGVLVARKGLLGFTATEMEQIRSSGEENAAGIAALGKALVLLQRIGLDLIQEEEQALIRRALTGLSQIGGLRVYGIKDPESPGFSRKVGVIVFSLKGLMANRVAKELAEKGGIGIRYGCHCAHILVKHILGVPPSLERFQRIIAGLFPGLRFPGVARMSLGIGNSAEDVDTFIQVLGNIAGKTRASTDSSAKYEHKGSPVLSKTNIKEEIKDFVRKATLRVYS